MLKCIFYFWEKREKMALDKLIQIHETNQRLEEINELKGDLPSVLYDQEIEFEKLEEMQKQSSLSLEELSKNLSNHQSSLTDYNNKLEWYINHWYCYMI